ncbi:DEAD/DEAH box helicase family protein [Spiroplasma turonicum]|uniref:Type III restriction enzyme, res subunit n=1 Tax=Spiroplasma turonicum TaxID=216946 RepID=A0A0K1P6R1_9MOLU|nr:DEAD/DEAH box helicase family protein [Spiroplasma turonicum]AKU79986.1 type III restriction enzyme, res subunit [Spiroplasma turonicum]ALX70988.1 ATP-dependent helicase IRC3 [Spiroplasma turonicum]
MSNKEWKRGLIDILLTENYRDLFNDKQIDSIEDVDNNWLSIQLSNYIKIRLDSIDNINDKLNLMNNILKLVSDEQFISLRAKTIGIELENYISNLSKNKLISKKIWNELEKEFLSSEFVYIISPFISAEMVYRLEIFLNESKFERFKIIIITTTYDGQAKFLAIEQLVELEKKYKSKFEVYIENLYTKSNTRLHIKAYYFNRSNKFSSLYIGSSNFTKTGQIAGKEYNVKISEFKEPELIKQFLFDFNTLLNDNSFIKINDEVRINELLNLQRETDFIIKEQKLLTINNNNNNIENKSFNEVNYKPFEYQNNIINVVINRIKNLQKIKHLLVMATGTGKTATIAFIYKELLSFIKINSFIYVAPSKEILDQALKTFRNILGNDTFGIDLYDSRNKDKNLEFENYVFITKDTLQNKLETLDKKSFDIVIFDEAHHIEAKTFNIIFETITKNAKQIFGLTATPERTDGVNINKYFDYEHACELRLYDAIENEMLSDFDYYFIKDDSINLENISINDKKFELKFNTIERYEFIYKTIIKRLGKKRTDVRAILFCSSTQNAMELSNYLISKGERSSYITTHNNFERDKNIDLFKNSEINYLCVMNILNEGVDIPEVDVIFFLRPTTSLIIYLQQLGRGLRKSLDKRLQIYDFVNNVDLNINNKFNPFMPFLNLTNNLKINMLEKVIDNVNSFSPGNSNFYLSNLEKKDFLNKLKRYEKNNLFKSILQEYREDGSFEEYENYFIEKNVDIYDFYLKNKKTFFDENNKKISILKAFLFPNIKELIMEIISFIETKKTPKNKLIKNIILWSFYNAPSKSDSYYYDLDQAINNIFITNNSINLKEILFILKFKLKNETLLYNKLSEEVDSFIGVELNHSQMQALCSLNITDNNFKGKGVQGIMHNKELNLFCIDANRTKSNLFSDSGNYFDEKNKIFYWDTPTSWKIDENLIDGIQKEFLNLEKNKTYLFYNDESISRQKTFLNRKFIGKVTNIIERKIIYKKNGNAIDKKLVLLLSLSK